MMFTVAALYKFADLPDYVELQAPLRELCEAHGIKGTLLLAAEGINGTIAGTRSAIDAVKAFLGNDPRFNGLEYKESSADSMPFYRLKVRLKKEIVTLGVDGVNPNVAVGTYVDPEDWNALVADPDVILIDTRNDYEFQVGTFKGAIDPKTATFRSFPEYVKANLDPKVHKKVAMFCTGGIRCEKASSYMLHEGFEEVFHLKGGILKYLEKVPAEESLWEGECFVFDERVSLKHNLELGEYRLCRACRQPLSQDDQASAYFKDGVTCPNCNDSLPEKQRLRAMERQRQIEIARQKGIRHIGR